MAKEKNETASKADLDRLLVDFPESHTIDGMPELHQRASMTILGYPVDVIAALAGMFAILALLVFLVQITPWFVAIPCAVFFGVKFGISRNKEGDGILVKKPKLRKKLDLLVPNLVRSGQVTPHQGRLIAVLEGQECSWAELERRINERTR